MQFRLGWKPILKGVGIVVICFAGLTGFAWLGVASRASRQRQLLDAVEFNNRAEVLRLLKFGTDVNGIVDGRNPISVAIAKEYRTANGVRIPSTDLNIVRDLLNVGANPNTLIKNYDETLLAWAVSRNNVAAINLLLEYKADVNKPSYGNQNTLSFAPNLQMAELLIETGAKPIKPSVWGTSVFESQVIANRLDVVKFFFDHGIRPAKNDNLVSIAVGNKHIPMLDLLLRNGLSVNEKHGDVFEPSKFYQPLQVAAAIDSPEMIQYLLKRGADLSAKNSEGRTALMESAKIRSSHALLCLISRGANVNDVDPDGKTALHLAIENESQVVRNWKGMPSGGSLVSIVEDLLRAKANPNIRDKYGWTPLFRAATLGKPEMIKLLLKYGCDPKLADREGKTALDRCREYSFTEEVQHILEAAK